MPSSTSNSSDLYPRPTWAPVHPLKLLLTLLALAAVWFAGDRLGGYLLGKLGDQSGFRYAQMYKGGLSQDYIILGNSRGVNTFYTPALNKETGLNGLNLSYNGLDLQTIETLYNDYLLHNNTTEILLIEISNLNQYDPSALASFKPFLGKSESLNALHRQNFSMSNAVSTLTHLFRFNTEQYYRILYYLRGNDQTWINRYMMAPELAANYTVSERQRKAFTEVNPDGIELLNRIIAVSRQHNVKPYLIVGPYLPARINQTDGFDDWLHTVEQETGMPVLDLSRSLESPEHFADPIHTNINAVKAINSLLIQHIFSQENPAATAPE